MSWTEYRKRRDLIEDVLGDVGRTGVARIPQSRAAAVKAVFGSERGFLEALHYRWNNTLAARMDALFESGDWADRVEVARIHDQLAAEFGPLRAILDVYRPQEAVVSFAAA